MQGLFTLSESDSKECFFCLDKVIRIQLCGNVLSQVINYGEFKHWLMVV